MLAAVVDSGLATMGAAAIGALALVVTAYWQRRNARSTDQVKAHLATNGHSPPSDPDTSVMDRVFRQLGYLGTKIDDAANASSRRFEHLEERQIQADRELNELRKAMYGAFSGHLKEHQKQAELDQLGREGRIERRTEPDDTPAGDPPVRDGGRPKARRKRGQPTVQDRGEHPFGLDQGSGRGSPGVDRDASGEGG